MSKIGRKPIDILETNVELKGQEVHYKGKHGFGMHAVPGEFIVSLDGKILRVQPRDGVDMRKHNAMWGLHRALLANKISGVSKEFEKKLQIHGLGYKAVLSGKKMELSLGYSHKINLDTPDGVSVDIDKTGQRIAVRSICKEAVGAFCDRIRSCRPPEPYKGTGIRLENEVIIRKSGKAKSGSE